MRRLPVYFLIDVSESMVGEPIQNVEDGLALIINELKKDPYALETVYTSIIVFAGKAKRISPMIEICQNYPPKLPIGGGTSLGMAVQFLIQDIEQNVVKTTMDCKGDWKPIVFLFTDGRPTDAYEATVQLWNSTYRNRISLIAISFGDDADLTVLSKLTDNVLVFKNASCEDYRKFFAWVTASIQASSKCISETNTDQVKLAPLSDDFLIKQDLPKTLNHVVDDSCAVFLAKCQSTGKPYLMKYRKNLRQSEMPNLSFEVLSYELVGAFVIDNSYFELSIECGLANAVNTEQLAGFPSCPSCGNSYGFSLCACGKLLCTGDSEANTCPWCGNVSNYSSDGMDRNINRTIG